MILFQRYLSLFLAIWIFSALKGNSQNLVPNPSFEDTVSCPSTLADLTQTSFWNAPTQGSPDYFNSCANNILIDVPNNGFGTQFALSGNGYVGIQVYDTQNVYSYREYIQVQLDQTLLVGQKYWVSFNASLSDMNDYGIQELGAYFSTTQINENSMDTALMVTPQIEFSDGVISDKNGWSQISGSFVAAGNESHIIIGNFNRKQTTTSTQVSSNNINYAYYYIDDVCVADDSLTCTRPLGYLEENAAINFTVYPNPTSNFLIVSNEGQEPYDITIYNVLGQLLYSENGIIDTKKQIDCQNYANGVIMISIKSNEKVLYYKFLKSKL